MESGDLKIFQTVAREGSITKAAAKLGYVQSNVTARIRQLEEELSAPLFYRQSRGVTLTSAGENLLRYADRIVRLLDEAIRSTRYAEKPSGPLSIGSLETTASVHLPSLMLAYHRRYPEVELSLATGHTGDLLRKVLDYELDGAFVVGPAEHPELESFVAFVEELVLIAEPSETDPDALLDKPLLFFGKGCSHRQRLEAWLAEAKPGPYRIMEFGTLEAIVGGVAAGLGVSLLTRSAVERWEAAGDIRCFPIPEKYRKSVVSFVYRRDVYRTAAFDKFLDALPRAERVNEDVPGAATERTTG